MRRRSYLRSNSDMVEVERLLEGSPERALTLTQIHKALPHITAARLSSLLGKLAGQPQVKVEEVHNGRRTVRAYRLVAPFDRVDWAAVARDYSAAGARPVEVARRHGLSYSTVYRRAKQFGWERRA